MEYRYPTQADHGREWVRDMLDKWKASGKRYLCFAFVKFHPHTLNDLPAWIYMYYRVLDTDVAHLKGRITFRIHVIDVAFSPNNNSPFAGDDNFHFRFGWNHDRTAWFRCDRAEQIQLLALDSFTYPDEKHLPSALRSSIAPAHLDADVPVAVVHTYP